MKDSQLSKQKQQGPNTKKNKKVRKFVKKQTPVAVYKKEAAKAAIIIDADSQVIIFSKNPNVRFSMASTTKIMTALVALDYYRKDSVLTVNVFNVEGSRLGMQYGERFYFEDLLYAMLLPSAN